jgi:hypothetical protein
MKKQNSQLEVIVRENALTPVEGKSLIERFGNYEQVAQEWEAKAHAIVVTSVTQTTEMAMAKQARKKFSEMRIEVEKARVAMKEQALRKGQAIDAVAKYLVSLIKPIEDYLKDQEDFSKIWAEKKLAEQQALEAQKVEEARIAKEKADALEQERIRKENERLKKEAEAKEKALEKERAEQAEKLRVIQLEKEKSEKAAEEKLMAEREKAREEAATAQKIQDAKDAEMARQQKEAEDKRLALEERNRKLKELADKELAEEKARAEKERLMQVNKQLELEKELANRITCPQCGYKFNLNK